MALKLFVEALAFRRRVLPEDHPDIATSMSNLASTYGDLYRHDEALPLQDEALAFRFQADSITRDAADNSLLWPASYPEDGSLAFTMTRP